MKISFDPLNPQSIHDAAKALRAYASRLMEADTKITRRLSEIAADEAREHYDESILVTATDSGVLAQGESVVFQEFGAGARISDPFEDGADVSFEIRKGAYSDLHQGEYAQSGYQKWHYNGEEYEYVTPTNALFYGMEAARAAAADVAKEVLREA